MRKWSRYLVGVVAVTGLLVPVTCVDAETCTLEMKRAGPMSSSMSKRPIELLVRSTSPQTFFQQLGGPPGMIVRPGTGPKPKFSDVIKKEPAQYATDTPFRGVAELGSRPLRLRARRRSSPGGSKKGGKGGGRQGKEGGEEAV